MLRNMYNWVIREAATKRAERTLAAVSFAESSFFPIPPDVMLVPMVLARREAWLRLVIIATVWSVIGGVAGYAIGYFLLDTVGMWLVNLYGLQDGLHRFQEQFTEYGVAIILIKGITPIPYKLVTIASGVAHFPLLPFIIASVVTRFGRFFLVAGLLYLFGDRARTFIERYLPWIFWIVLVGIVLGFVLALKVV